jgi:HEPN domain-containing protein
MKPESARFLRKAGEILLKARDALEHWPDEAGRAAYLAVFHAAQALIFEKTGDVAKTKDDPNCDAELRFFLGNAWRSLGHKRKE